MASLNNSKRPPASCPGCSHDMVVKALDKALSKMGIEGNEVVLVSDIGCSGLFDTYFNTHAFHGLHGRALTYATGLKVAERRQIPCVRWECAGEGDKKPRTMVRFRMSYIKSFIESHYRTEI